jgi:diaminopimelate epimerase
MRVRFVHCHGSGNDFPLIDARGLGLDRESWARIARALADRNGPVGGDGLLLLERGDAETAFAMVMMNSDGSEAETCLNGLRCVARLGFETLGLREARVRLKTSTAEVSRDPDVAAGVYTVRERAGPASLAVAAWPMHVSTEQVVEAPVTPLATERVFTAVAMPNPHLVSFVDRIDERELSAIGEACEAAPAWLPNRANVSFVEQRGEGVLFVRTFERGVGLTDSCGSAMAASAYAACLTGRARWGDALTVLNRGGMVGAVVEADGMVSLSGNATWEWAGSIHVDPTTGIASDLVVEERFDAEVAAWALVKEKATRPG